jgi:hypothetical protein
MCLWEEGYWICGFVIVNLHVNHFVSWNKRLGDLCKD